MLKQRDENTCNDNVRFKYDIDYAEYKGLITPSGLMTAAWIFTVKYTYR